MPNETFRFQSPAEISARFEKIDSVDQRLVNPLLEYALLNQNYNFRQAILYRIFVDLLYTYIVENTIDPETDIPVNSLFAAWIGANSESAPDIESKLNQRMAKDTAVQFVATNGISESVIMGAIHGMMVPND